MIVAAVHDLGSTPAVQVLVALIGAMGLIGVALVQSMRRSTSTAKVERALLADDMAHRIGQPNGMGNVTQMLERILHGQTGQDRRLARLEERANTSVELTSALGARLAELEPVVRANSENLAELADRQSDN